MYYSTPTAYTKKTHKYNAYISAVDKLKVFKSYL